MSKHKDIEFPHVVSVELPKDRKDVAVVSKDQEHILQKILDTNYKGAVNSEEGKWIIDPGFQLEKLGVGKFKITHLWGQQNTNIGLSLLEHPGIIKMIEHHPLYFIVEILVDGKLTDLDFCFSLSMVISQPARK